MASKSRVIYIGVTNNLIRRVSEHQNKLHPESFTAKYHCERLVYYEEFQDIYRAIAKEKELKAWRRAKKIALIETTNPFGKNYSFCESIQHVDRDSSPIKVKMF